MNDVALRANDVLRNDVGYANDDGFASPRFLKLPTPATAKKAA